MNQSVNKYIYRTLLILSFLAINTLVLFGISSVLAYMNTGAERSSILNLNNKQASVFHPQVKWVVDNYDGISIAEQSLHRIENDYLRAWQIRQNALLNNTTKGIDIYYTNSAKQKLMEVVKLNTAQNITINSTTLNHQLYLKFYSADGRLVVFDDKNVHQVSEINDNQTSLITQQELHNYKVMMLLEDGYWRIRHMQLNSVEQLSPIDTTAQLYKPIKIENIKGTNYYPKNSPWDMFGNNFNELQLDKDLQLMQDMGLNSVRIFLQYQDFGGAIVKPEKLKKLKVFLDLAYQRKIYCIVTLFDFYGNYDVTDWVITQKHAKQIVEHFKDHPGILAWDIKNEPDLDFASRGQERVLSWLDNMVRNIKTWDNNHMVTIGWSNTESAHHLSNQLDIVSFHYYKNLELFNQDVNALKSKVKGKQIVLQEYGYSSYNGIWNGFSGSEEDQANYYAKIQSLIHEQELPYLFWTLYDFKEVPNSVVGWRPWRKKPQRFYGCFDAKGNRKPVYFKLITK